MLPLALESDRDRSGAHKHAHKGDGERGSLVCSRRKMERLEKNNLKICVSERERERERAMSKIGLWIWKALVRLYKMTTLFLFAIRLPLQNWFDLLLSPKWGKEIRVGVFTAMHK